MASFDKQGTSRALFKNTGIIALGQISTKFINFFLLPLYTAILTTEEYGLVDLLSTYANLIAILVGLQIYQALFRFLVTVRKDEQRIKSIISTATGATLVALLIYAVCFIGIQYFVNLECKWYLLAGVVTSIFLQLTTNVARGLGKNGDYAFGSFLSATIILALNILLVAVLRLGVQAMLFAHVVGPLIGGICLVIKDKLYRYVSIKAVSNKELYTILHYAIPLIPNELSWLIIHASDRIVVSHFLSVAVNGLIAVASKFSAIYTTFFSFFNASWTEQVVLHYRDEGGPEYICSMFDKIITFFGSVAIGIISCMPFVFTLLVNESFHEAYGLIPLFLIAVFFNAVVGMVSAIYLINNETKKVAISTAMAAAINLITDIGLIKFIGMYAAPVSSILAYLTISFWRLVDVNKRHCRVVMPLKKVALLIGMLIIALGAYYQTSRIVQAIALVCVAGIALYLNRLFLKEFVGLLRKCE